MDARDLVQDREHLKNRLIVALDLPSKAEALAMVDQLSDNVLWYKVGLELYLAEGAGMVQQLTGRGKQVFLDLKLHDIPNTVAGAIRSVAGSGAALLTVHASGGPAMLHAAVQTARALEAAPRLLAVTVLTSMDEQELQAVGVQDRAPEQVKRLGRMALHCRVDGLVCSPRELLAMRDITGPEPLLVVPGIRSAADEIGDQRRTASATEAISDGASVIVVGRPITQAVDPVHAAQRILAELAMGLEAPRTGRARPSPGIF